MNCLRAWACILVLGTVCAVTACEDTLDEPLTFEAAKELVLAKMVPTPESEAKLIIFGHTDLLQPGDVIHPYQFPGLQPFPEPRRVASEEWFFWFDDAPGAHFAHPSRFVFVNRSTGKIKMSEEEWWPVLNDQGLWVERESYWDEDNWVYSNVEYRPVDIPQSSKLIHPVSPHAEPNRAANGSATALITNPVSRRAEPNPVAGGSATALVVNGWTDGQSGEEDFTANGDGMHDALTATGFDTTYLGPPEDGNPDIDGISSIDAINSWFTQKSGELEAGDTLFVYIGAHGNEGLLGPLSDINLRNRLSEFDPGVNVIVVLQGCYSGSFVDPLIDQVNLIVTSTEADSWSYGDMDLLGADSNYDDVGSEFSSGYIEDWNNLWKSSTDVARLASRAESEGRNFFVLLAEEATISAKELDLAYQLGFEIPQVKPGNRAGTQIVEPPPAPVSPDIGYADPEGDVFDCESGALVAGHPELDLINLDLSVDEAGEQISVKFTFKEAPQENEFVSAFLNLSPGVVLPSGPLGDPFAHMPLYLYTWRMNDDSFGALMEQVGGEFQIADASVELGIAGATMSADLVWDWDMWGGETLVTFAGSTDSLGSCDLVKHIEFIAGF